MKNLLIIALLLSCSTAKAGFAIYPEWFGAVANDGKDDAAAFGRAAIVANLYGGVVKITNGVYRLSHEPRMIYITSTGGSYIELVDHSVKERIDQNKIKSPFGNGWITVWEHKEFSEIRGLDTVRYVYVR